MQRAPKTQLKRWGSEDGEGTRKLNWTMSKEPKANGMR